MNKENQMMQQIKAYQKRLKDYELYFHENKKARKEYVKWKETTLK